MSTVKTNRLGLELASYRGSKTTLCAGCGHNAITERIIDACYEMGVDAKKVVKLSGIGCSSKSPAYFLNQSHGFNSVHGRMPSISCADRKISGAPRMADTPGGTGRMLGAAKMNINAPMARSPSNASRSATDTRCRLLS